MTKNMVCCSFPFRFEALNETQLIEKKFCECENSPLYALIGK